METPPPAGVGGVPRLTTVTSAHLVLPRLSGVARAGVPPAGTHTLLVGAAPCLHHGGAGAQCALMEADSQCGPPWGAEGDIGHQVATEVPRNSLRQEARPGTELGDPPRPRLVTCLHCPRRQCCLPLMAPCKRLHPFPSRLAESGQTAGSLPG